MSRCIGKTCTQRAVSTVSFRGEGGAGFGYIFLCADVGEHLSFCGHLLDEHCPEFGGFRAQIGHRSTSISPHLAGVGMFLSEFGQYRARWWPNLIRIWPNLGNFGRIWGRGWPELSHVVATIAIPDVSCLIWAKGGPNLSIVARFRPGAARTWPKLDRIPPGVSRLRPNRTRLGPDSARSQPNHRDVGCRLPAVGRTLTREACRTNKSVVCSSEVPGSWGASFGEVPGRVN